MLKKVSLVLCATAFIFSCSDETKEEPIKIKGEIKGQVYLRNEFGGTESDLSGLKISLEGSDNIQSTIGADGKYSFQNVPFGTYNIIGEKSGFTITKITGVRVAGGQPLYQSLTMVRHSTTRINDISLAHIANWITITGKMMHSQTGDYPWNYLITFLSNTPDVSPEKHNQSFVNSFSGVSGSSVSWSITADQIKFPPGTTVYLKIYGAPNPLTSFFNFERGRYEYLGLSNTPSNTVSIML